MEKNGWLARAGEAPHARARQTYRITSAGRRLLGGLKRDVAELYRELVLGEGPKRSRSRARRGEGTRG
jgi:DNA-binding PadR family transcriptional regulator